MRYVCEEIDFCIVDFLLRLELQFAEPLFVPDIRPPDQIPEQYGKDKQQRQDIDSPRCR